MQEIHVKDLSYLNELPPENLQQVSSIHLNWNSNITELPEIVYKCSNLESLKLYRLKIRTLSPKISQLKSLKVLSFNSCPLVELPPEISHLQELEILELQDAKIKNFPKALLQLPNLVELNFYRSAIQDLPDGIQKLKQLKKLKLSHSQIKELPTGLEELTDLEELGLYGTGITYIPEWFSKLKKMKILALPKQSFQSIPYFLFKLKKLAYYCIPSFKVTGVDEVITNQLKQYLKRHANEDCARAYVHLMLNPDKPSNIPAKYFVEVSNIDDKDIVKKAINYLRKILPTTLKQAPLINGSEIAFLGNFDGLGIDYIKEQLAQKGISSSTKVSKTTSHVVLCYENKRKFDPSKFPNLVLLSNEEMINWMKANEGAGYLEDNQEADNFQMQESIRDLLLSTSIENVNTALEMLKSGGIAQSMVLPLLIAYSGLGSRTEEGKQARANVREALYKSPLSESAKKTIRGGVSKSGFSFHPNRDRDERRYMKRLERKGHSEFGMTEMAKYYFKTERQGYVYLFESNHGIPNLFGMAPRSHFQVDIGRWYIQNFEESLRHLVIIMLTRMHQQMLHLNSTTSIVLLNGPDKRRYLHKVGPGAND